MAFCEHCGVKLEEGAGFCAGCGMKVETGSGGSRQGLKKRGPIGKINDCMDKRATEATLSPDTGLVGRLAYICAKRQKIIFWLIIAGMFMMVFGMFTGNKYAKIVQESRHSAYPQLTIGKTFDTLFDGEAQWNYDSDDECVTVSGECSYGGKNVMMVVGISIEDGKAGGYQYIMIDGKYVDFLELGTILNNIYIYAYEQNGISVDNIDMGW